MSDAIKKDPSHEEFCKFVDDVRTNSGWNKEQTYAFLADTCNKHVSSIRRYVSGTQDCPWLVWAYLNLELLGREV